VRDAVVDFVGKWSEKTEIPAERFVGWIGIARGKFFAWCKRYGKANEHNALVPRDHWLTPEEKQAIIDFHGQFPLEGYRRLTFMMIDRDIVAVSPSSVYRVLAGAGLLDRWNRKPSKKGSGFVQPLRPHEHWHIDVAYLNLGGTFYYLCSVLDGASRAGVSGRPEAGAPLGQRGRAGHLSLIIHPDVLRLGLRRDAQAHEVAQGRAA